MLPDFLGIGAQKAGTTWLYRRLRTHPALFLPEKKELKFFCHPRPLAWYQAQFASARPGQVKGEISPSYFVHPRVVERMTALVPGARLLAILRDPAERAFSQWNMARKLGNIRREVPFLEAFHHNLQFVRERGLYSRLLERFRPHYALGDRLLVLFYEDLLADPAGFLRRICLFLGVDETWPFPDLDQRVWVTEKAYTLSPAEEEEVRAFYRPSVDELEDLLGRDLSGWKRPRSQAVSF